MKKSLIYQVLSILFFVFILLNCKSSPKQQPEKPPAPVVQTVPSPSRGVDIWSLLQRGDDKAKGYFLGEVDVNAVDSQGRTPLHYAAENKDAQLAAFFIALGANVNALDNSAMSPLGISIEKNDTQTAKILVNAKADIHQEIKNTTPAKTALSSQSDIFKALLTPASVETYDKDGKTILLLASIEGNVQCVNEILFMRPSAVLINKKDSTGLGALDYALKRADSKNHMNISEQLILAGGSSENPLYQYFAPAARSANYDIRRSEGIALIHYAVIKNYPGLISFLFDKKIDINLKSSSGATAFHEAVRSGNLELIQLILANGADVNAKDAKGNTALHTGIPSSVHREVVALLLENGADPNLRDEHGETPLHIAVILNRSVSVIQAILNGGADVQIRNIEGKTPLYIAIQEKRESLIPLLLSYNSEIFASDISGITPFSLALTAGDNILNLLITPETVIQRDSAGNTLLHVAVRNRANTKQIGKILDNNAVVDARNRTGDTALHIAVRTNQREAGEFLISRSADIFSANASGESLLYFALTASPARNWIINRSTVLARDPMGNSMLHYAAQWKLDAAIPLIIKNGISVNEQNATGETSLFMAIKSDSPSTIKVLLENKADINARDMQGNSALHSSVRWNAVNSVPALLSNGIDINVHTLSGNTPLHDSVTLGMSEIETTLIKNGANLEIRNIDGNTPFMEAVRSGFILSVNRLAAAKADPSTRNTRGDTPLHIAVGMERTDLAEILLKSGVSIHARNTRNITPYQSSLGISQQMVSALLSGDRVNVPDDMGNSPLHIALQEKASSQIIRTIISKGARINSVDSNGRTPLRLAVDLNQYDNIKILSEAGADPFLVAADSKTPAEISFEKGIDCIRAIFSGRAINSRDSMENTILHLAARHGNPESINILLGLGANKTYRNISSENPYEIALRWNKNDNAEALK